jgi:uncharacterized damage-inducible protein DinB
MSRLAASILAQAQHSLRDHHLPRITRCLTLLPEKEIWWRPHRTSNSVGNLVLHLCGNVRQWIVSGVGGAPDRRQRDQEFAERGPIPKRRLIAQLTRTVNEACRVLQKASAAGLAKPRLIQGYRVTGFEAIAHVTEHFAHHSGQIILITKMRLRRDLGFTRLPVEKPESAQAENSPPSKGQVRKGAAAPPWDAKGVKLPRAS